MIAKTARRLHWCLAALISITIGLGTAVSAAAAADSLKVRLSTVPIDPATRATVTGSGTAAGSLDGMKLKLEGSFSGLHSPAHGAHLNLGPARGVRGPKIHDVTVPAAPNGTFRVEITLTPEEADAVRRGQVYLQIDSENAPEGNLWGWLLE